MSSPGVYALDDQGLDHDVGEINRGAPYVLALAAELERRGYLNRKNKRYAAAAAR